MKLFICTLLVALTFSIAQAREDIQTLTKEIQNAATGNGWQTVKDSNSITLIHSNVQFLNPVSLPMSVDDEQTWKEFSFTNDYRITILFDSKLSLQEYDEVSKLRDKFIADRTKGLNPQTKKYFSESEKAKSLLRLPDFYSDNQSIYVYCSDRNFFRFRPAKIVAVHDKIIELLNKNCSKYVTNAVALNP